MRCQIYRNARMERKELHFKRDGLGIDNPLKASRQGNRSGLSGDTTRGVAVDEVLVRWTTEKVGRPHPL